MVHIKRRIRPEILPNLHNLHPVMARIYAARGITEVDDLIMDLKKLPTYDALMGINQAVLRIEHAFNQQETIMVIGDFDADGATSTALAVDALKKLGAKEVTFLVPNRFIYGYGLTPPLVELAAQSRPHLLITVDNGISSVEGVLKAKELGIDVIITDHHLPGELLPDACAIVNPNQVGDTFSSKCMAGVGVIFYVMLALRRHLQQQNWFEKQSIPIPNMAQFLDLVALGTVADVVPLDCNNRILVHQGISRIKQGLTRPGIQALIDVAGKNNAYLRASDLGFSIAPRLNAAGRIDDMSIGIDCLLCDSPERARTLAFQLDSLNEERRHIEQEMRLQAIQVLQLLTKKLNQKALPAGLCLKDKHWHQGVIGILAGRLKEMYHRPVFVFAQVSEQELKGSGRSVASVNIRDILAQIDSDYPGLISKFGGHAMAAGMSLLPQNFELFKQYFEIEIAKHLSAENCVGEIWVDGELEPHEMTLEVARLIQEGGPWGQQFPEPLFEGTFNIVTQRLVGQKHLKMTLRTNNSPTLIDAIAFNVNLEQWPNERMRNISAVYSLDVNVYQGIARLQIIVHHFEPVMSPVEMV